MGNTFDGQPVFARQLNAQGAMAALLKDAIKPNLVQTLEGNPAILHGGPFANIAQGTNTILATKMGMSLADYVVTEAGFGADLGAEKFLNIKCGYAGVTPKCVMIVATIRALKYHGGVDVKELKNENVEALKKGLGKLEIYNKNQIRWFYDLTEIYNNLTNSKEDDFSLEAFQKEPSIGFPNNDFSLEYLL